MVVTVEVDGDRSWRFDEPGWLDLAFGASDRLTYWWSARHLVVMPESESEPHVISVDEDLRFVFAGENHWLLVCETSIRLITAGNEVSRLEFGDPIVLARWKGGRLRVRDESGRDTEIDIVDGRLVA
jgi:hypothetical protein